MFFYTAEKQKCSLRLMPMKEVVATEGFGREFAVSGAEDSRRLSELVTSAARSLFEMHEPLTAASRRRARQPAVFRESSGRVRVAYKEVVVRFRPGTSASLRDKILRKHSFQTRTKNPFHGRQYVIKHKNDRCVGSDLIDVANDFAEMDEVLFATPNFASQYTRTALPAIHPEQWHLWNRGYWVDQLVDEDVNIRGAWKKSLGQGVVVAVLDDGIDVEHPNLKSRILKNPDPSDPKDLCGRDFFVPADTPDHYDPRPKRFRFPFHKTVGNDIHGTPCAGVVAAAGTLGKVRGAAPKARILPVKVFHAEDLASDERVANAIRYSSKIADILSCSWTGGMSPDIELAIETDAALGRNGKGTAVFCAAGNGFKKPVDFPAALDSAIAVGASTDQGEIANYSNIGPEMSIVAPSNGGVSGTYTTDVSAANRGYNVGDDDMGGADGLHTNDFGGTSSATPLAAGVAALVLAAKPSLTRDELRGVLEATAEKIGRGYGADGHSNTFGFGRVDAEQAMKHVATLGGGKGKGKKKTGKPRRGVRKRP